jgi:hypothetical protein
LWWGWHNFKGFWVTEAALMTAMPAYNLMSLLSIIRLKPPALASGRLVCQGVLRAAFSYKQTVQHTLKTLRYKLYARAGYLTKDGGIEKVRPCHRHATA